MRIAIGCDHKGKDLKQLVVEKVAQMGHQYQDFGCFGTNSVDYPDIAKMVAQAVASAEFERGILICNTGIGMSIAANKVKGIRAAQCFDVFSAQRARQHNDANILCLGAVQEADSVAQVLEVFLTTEFEGGRHLRRVDKIKAMED